MFLKVFTIENPQQTQKEYPSEPAAVVSFRDDYIKWGRIEVSWGVRVLSTLTGDTPPSEFVF